MQSSWYKYSCKQNTYGKQSVSGSVVGQSVIPTLMHNCEDISTHKCGARSGLPQLLHTLCSHSIVEQLVLSSGHFITGHGPKLQTGPYTQVSHQSGCNDAITTDSNPPIPRTSTNDCPCHTTQPSACFSMPDKAGTKSRGSGRGQGKVPLLAAASPTRANSHWRSTGGKTHYSTCKQRAQFQGLNSQRTLT